ncbi:MAG: sigma-70 family RNA polymerase sigma factor [Ignavibacteriaceae bacterium]|nr:sigma-70 family RNA polymerase sigma factor [Ignavibacteriaceae bacterium]
MAPDDFELIQKANNGDTIAFEELIYRHDRNVLSIALKYTRNEDDAKDVYQEVFLRVFKGLKNFKFKSEFSTWLFRITVNVCLTYKSKLSRHETIPLGANENDDDEYSPGNSIAADESSSPENILLGNEIGERINNALDTLSPKQKLVFTLKHYEGYKLKEIALMLDITEGTSKKYLFEAVHKLRVQLVELYI